MTTPLQQARQAASAHGADLLYITPARDNVWDKMLEDFQKAKKPSKWKYRMRSIKGNFQSVRYENGQFVHNEDNCLKVVMSVSMLEELRSQENVHFFARRELPTASDFAEGEYNELLNEFLTGNHQPRNHPVRVPTAAGQPVRG